MQPRLGDVGYIAIFPFAIPNFGLLSVLLFLENVYWTIKYRTDINHVIDNVYSSFEDVSFIFLAQLILQIGNI